MTTTSRTPAPHDAGEVRPLGLWLAFLALVLLLLSACGGGGSSLAGVGSGGTGVATGTVSGFGSVIVDGVEYDDSNSDATSDDSSGNSQNVEVKLGQQVRVSYDVSGKAARNILVMPQLVGPVSAVVDSGGWLRVMGQWVRLVTSTSDATLSTPTVLSGYTLSSTIAVGDDVEVHGSWIYDSTRFAYVLVATRLEKLSVAADPVQLGGVVLNVAATGFDLNASGTFPVTASSLPASLSNGQAVRVWVRRAALPTKPWVAQRVMRSSLRNEDLASSQKLDVAGLPSSYDPVSRTVAIAGMQVRLASGIGLDEAALARGEFVALQVSRSDSGLIASSGKQRSVLSSTLGAEVEIKAVTSGIDWSATPSVSFRLRDTDIVAPAAAIAANCKSIALSADVYVQVKGRLPAPGQPVGATEVQCTTTAPATSTIERVGLVRSVDLANSTLVLGLPLGDVTARWDSTTYFEKRPETLPGLLVEVEGVITKGSSELRLKKVKRPR